MTQFTYSDNLFSDLFKEVNGFRPRGDILGAWDLASPERKQEIWDGLCAELDDLIDREQREAIEAQREFEGEIAQIIEIGAQDRVTALRWLIEAACEGELDNSQNVEGSLWFASGQRMDYTVIRAYMDEAKLNLAC